MVTGGGFRVRGGGFRVTEGGFRVRAVREVSDDRSPASVTLLCYNATSQ